MKPYGLVLLFALATSVAAQEKNLHILSLIEENDAISDPAPGRHQDRHYTQGIKGIYTQPAELKWLGEHLWSIGKPRQTSNSIAWIFGQNIFTPEDDRATNLITSDRPYAGWMYLGVAMQRIGTTAKSNSTLESIEFDAGVIGPEAQGQLAQNTVHKWRHFRPFSGWSNQLNTEPAFEFKYGRALKLGLAQNTRYFQFIPNIGADIGTVRVSGNVGFTTRLGWNLPDDFGPQTIDSPIVISSGRQPGNWGIYLLGQIQGRVIARNAFLDGNLYQSSPSIPKNALVADFAWGIGFTPCQNFELSWMLITRTAEFKGQHGNDQFGSLALKCKWFF